MIDLSIIIVSYNTKDLLKKCIDSVAEDLRNFKKKTSLSGEIIVVDNDSTDGSREFLQRDCHGSPKATLAMTVILNKKNLGFGGANNVGAGVARGRYLLFLNSDTEVKAGALGKMAGFLDQNPKVGIASCQLVNTDDSVQFQGGYLPRLSTVAAWALFLDDLPILRGILPSYQMRSILRADPRYHFLDTLGGGGVSSSIVSKMTSSGQLVDPVRRRGNLPTLAAVSARNFWFIGWVGGTAMFVRREAWEELGGFDEKIFMYGEDVELCYRANKQGWKVAINPEAEIVHAGKASGGKWVTGEVEGLLYIFRKHKPGWEMPFLRGILAAGMGLRWVIFGILGGDEKLRRGYAEAVGVILRAGRSPG